MTPNTPTNSDNIDLDKILTDMVENTVMWLTNDLPALLEQDRIAKIRRVHKDQILQNLPEAKAALQTLLDNEKTKARLDEQFSIYNEISKLDGYSIKGKALAIVSEHNLKARTTLQSKLGKKQ